MNILPIEIEASSKHDLVVTMLQLLAVRDNKSKTTKTLRPKVIRLLAFYIMYGVDTSTKTLASDTFKCSIDSIYNMNSEAVRYGYLIKTKGTHTIKLSKDLKAIEAYVKQQNEFNRKNDQRAFVTMVVVNYG